ncbi:hypothetical protein [Streptococcus thoraltensis]|uniref:hypothetical protein n=1 Tax=Streptococcus thoraltensis TaxID=55085 RepID=UPI00036AED35|nr:hypothetical protein [Streptococcus thoraltensis]MDY4762053.1 hypothetical protein [Streptococcus thoraltensis]
MGLKKTLAAGVAAFLAYRAFQKRREIAETYNTEKDRFASMNKDKENIQKQLSIIKSELAKVNELSEDTQHKVRVFQKDLEPRLQIIKEKTDHLQNHLDTKSS